MPVVVFFLSTIPNFVVIEQWNIIKLSFKWIQQPTSYDLSLLKNTFPFDFRNWFILKWLSEEGIAQQKSLIWANSDGDRVVYASLNTSGCHQLGYIDYQEDQSDANSIRYSIVSLLFVFPFFFVEIYHPALYSIAFNSIDGLQPGGPLPRIELKVLQIESQREIYLALSDNVNQRELLLVQVKWISPESFVSVWMTRDQNGTSVFHCKVTESSADCNEVKLHQTWFIRWKWSSFPTKIHREEAKNNRWLKPFGVFSSAEDDGAFVFISQANYDEIRGGQVLLYFKPPWHKTISVNLDQLIVDRIVAWNTRLQTT